MKLLPFKQSKSRANEDEDGDRGRGGVSSGTEEVA